MDESLPETIILEMRQTLIEADLECGCRGRAEHALDRLAATNVLRKATGRLADARGHRDAIRRLTNFLAELDELGPEESDVTSFEEAALLFEEMSHVALAGAASIRSAGDAVRAFQELPRDDAATAPVERRS